LAIIFNDNRINLNGFYVIRSKNNFSSNRFPSFIRSHLIKNKISKAIKNIAMFILFDWLNNMRMVTNN